MKRKTNALLAALIAGALTSVSAVSFAQSEQSASAPSAADQKAAGAQAKADKKKTEAQSDVNEAGRRQGEECEEG